MGVVVSEDERNSYLHLWLVVGHLLGIDYEALRRKQLDPREEPLDLEEMRLVGRALFRRNVEATPHGQALTASLIDMSRASMVRPFRWLPPTATRWLIKDEAGDVLEVPAALRPMLMVFDMGRPLARVLSRRKSGRPFAWAMHVNTRRVYDSWIEANRGDRPPWEIPDNLRPRSMQTRLKVAAARVKGKP
jgi:hypothetical protein